jgi:hypothetical protein
MKYWRVIKLVIMEQRSLRMKLLYIKRRKGKLIVIIIPKKRSQKIHL